MLQFAPPPPQFVWMKLKNFECLVHIDLNLNGEDPILYAFILLIIIKLWSWKGLWSYSIIVRNRCKNVVFIRHQSSLWKILPRLVQQFFYEKRFPRWGGSSSPTWMIVLLNSSIKDNCGGEPSIFSMVFLIMSKSPLMIQGKLKSNLGSIMNGQCGSHLKLVWCIWYHTIDDFFIETNFKSRHLVWVIDLYNVEDGFWEKPNFFEGNVIIGPYEGMIR